MRKTSGVLSLAIVLALGALPLQAAAASETPAGHSVTAKEYKNCTALQKAYPHGVGKKGAKDKTSGTPVRNFKVSNALYAANKKSDRDKDGIACEKK